MTTPNDLPGHWASLKRLLTSALDSERELLPIETQNEIAEFIEHREYGVALDVLVGTIESAKASPSPVGASALAEAQRLMA